MVTHGHGSGPPPVRFCVRLSNRLSIAFLPVPAPGGTTPVLDSAAEEADQLALNATPPPPRQGHAEVPRPLLRPLGARDGLARDAEGPRHCGLGLPVAAQQADGGGLFGGQRLGTAREPPFLGGPPDSGGDASLCARHVVHLGGESPLRAVMTGTASLSKGVHREVESEGSLWQNSDSTNRNRIQGRRSGVTRQWTGRPDSHSDRCAGKSGGDRRKDVRLTLGGLWGCLEDPTTAPATVGEGPGEVSRGHSSPDGSG